MVGAQQPDTTETNPQAAVAGAQPVPAAPVPQGQEAAPEGPAACVVPPTSLTVASTETLRDRGVNDPAMFLVQWDAGVINNSGEPILVTARIASSDSEAGGDWEGTFARVPAGEAYLWPMSYVTNNAGGAAGPTQWRYVDQVLAVRDSPECEDLLMIPTDGMAKSAIPAVVPRLPANAQIARP